ncbi:MAG: hypothetical protein HOW71_36555 [Nonomuraea sp.]|nr:hypothetical protein [Nonomuraea sp.]
MLDGEAGMGLVAVALDEVGHSRRRQEELGIEEDPGLELPVTVIALICTVAVVISSA